MAIICVAFGTVGGPCERFPEWSDGWWSCVVKVIRRLVLQVTTWPTTIHRPQHMLQCPTPDLT